MGYNKNILQNNIKGQIIAGAVFVIAVFILIGLVGYEFVTGNPLTVPGINLEKILTSPPPPAPPSRTGGGFTSSPSGTPTSTTPGPSPILPTANPSPTVSSISPNKGYTGSVINYVIISGANFRAGATVELAKPGEANILGNGFVVQNAGEISRGYLDLRNKNVGVWNVVVKNYDGTSGILLGGFTILSQGVTPPPETPPPPPPPGTPPPPPPPATLKVITTVINDDNGSATASNFTINVKLAGNHVSGSPASGVPQPGRSYTLNPGTYSVSENPVSGYSVSFSGDCNSSGEITLASNDNKTCTVVNNDNPAGPPPPPTAPGAPTNPQATGGNGRVTLSWSAPASNGGASITNYKVYKSEAPNGEILLTSGGCSGLGNILTCIDENATNGFVYYYKISAVNAANLEGPKSSEVIGEPNSPTRFYFSSAMNPPINNVPISNEWEKTGTDFFRSLLASPKFNSTNQSSTSVATNNPAPQFDFVMSQYISPALAAQTIGGRVKGQLSIADSIQICSLCNPAVVIRVRLSDGTMRTLLNYFPPEFDLNNKYSATPQNRFFPPSSQLQGLVGVDAGSRLIVELGHRNFAPGSPGVNYYIGDSKTEDLPENQTDPSSTAKNPWIEFSETILFE